jgi:uncharacterized protein YecT (DUF1311 family)
MPLLSVLAAAGAMAAQAAPSPAPCPRTGTTTDINQCLIAEAASADAERVRYFQAAQTRLKQEAPPSDAAAVALPAEIGKVEAAWTTYRDLECGAVFDYWSAGTIRVMMEESCYIDLTRQHTHTLWSEWLTYMDSTPPILPEPSAATEP